MNSIASDLMNAPVEGLNLAPGTLSGQFGETGDLMVFLRHLG
jgi:hypothetical protein